MEWDDLIIVSIDMKRLKINPCSRNLLRRIITVLFIIIAALGSNCRGDSPVEPSLLETGMPKKISLPTPITDGDHSLESTLHDRRSVREFTDEPLTIAEISQLLWAAQGITDSRGFRTAPSAGALYPIELYVVTEEGLFHYDPYDHSMALIKEGDLRADLCKAGLNQEALSEAPVIFVLTVVYERVEVKYGPDRSPRYVHLEAGHAAQNLLLQAVSLNLGATPIGAFYDKQAQSVLDLPSQHEPLYLIPVGRPK
jgi:SagB-type dehydrogenase family enzyme